ncbi:MAG TPA: diguanylate cyclase [Pyrinomonadaceae bacterium]|nr:diguanylate cyclase [Pyrinomonadaceae bacterium]
MTILLISHAEETREDVKFFLDLAGYTSVVTVSSFSEALAVLSRQTIGNSTGGAVEQSALIDERNGPAIDLILLSADLEDVDLIGACQILGSTPAWRRIPVILLRQNIPATQLEAALAAGVFDFLNLPVFPTELRARLRAAEQLKESIAAQHALERELIEASTRLQVAERRYETLSEEWRREGERDALTRLYNKRWFHERLGLELRSASRRGVYLSLLFLDLDHFNSYNEYYGREAGDQCLASVAAAIKGALQRSIDSVARVGGEEFAIILPDTNARGAVVVASKILALVRALQIPHEKSPVAPQVTASIGIDARLPTPRLGNASVILAADQQLHQAKKLGRNRYCISVEQAANSHSVLGKLF